ncbi:MAG: hypothetical protein JWP62_2949, partial [Blastococcus sp.]|nr:hypothetical protein [Blastococcus sp.]
PLVEFQTGRPQPVAEAGRRIGLTGDDDEQTGHVARLVNQPRQASFRGSPRACEG